MKIFQKSATDFNTGNHIGVRADTVWMMNEKQKDAHIRVLLTKQLFIVPCVNFNYNFQSRSPLINAFVDQLLIETGTAGTHSVFEILQTHDPNSVHNFTSCCRAPQTA